MFCPQCGIDQSQELKFCKQCGANLHAVRQVLSTRETSDKFDWSKTWVAEMFLSEGERKKRVEELERQRGITPEVKRYREVKAGVITTAVGVGSMIFLYVIAQGIVSGNGVPHNQAELISRLWVAGVVPFFVGIALIINGLFVSKKLAEAVRREPRETLEAAKITQQNITRPFPQSADPSDLDPSDFSVIEDTTRNLSRSGQEK